MKISKDFEFAAAHQLVLPYDSPCQRLHGHNYKLRVTINGNINKSGMVMDFKELKNIVNREVISVLDHQDLTNFFNKDPRNCVKYRVNATAENMCIWIYQKITKALTNNVSVIKVQLWETTDSMAEYP